jgi:hypothetical protein
MARQQLAHFTGLVRREAARVGVCALIVTGKVGVLVVVRRSLDVATAYLTTTTYAPQDGVLRLVPGVIVAPRKVVPGLTAFITSNR